MTTPFASKKIPDGKLFRRKHGFRVEQVPPGETKTIEINVPYDFCKINEIEIVNGFSGNTISLKVKDTPTGTISQGLQETNYTPIPNLVLNQFGFDVELPNGFYRDKSEYDANVFRDMKIVVEYKNNSDQTRDLKGNIIFHEVKQ